MFDFTNVTNVIETHHLNINNCDYNVNFDDATILKYFQNIIYFKIELLKKTTLQISCSHLLFVMFHIKTKIRENN
jgi:hypothetical protein